MAWKGGFTGQGYDRAGYRVWLRAQPKPTWVNKIVIHNTGAPYMKPPVAPSARIANLANYYKKLGWSSGPHGFAILDKFYPGTPVTQKGTHSPGYNADGWGFEAEGDYRKGKHDPKTGDGAKTWDTMAWVTAEHLEWMGWEPTAERIKLHREDPRTTHACPGDLVMKDWFLNLVRAAMGRPAPAPVPKPPLPKPAYTDAWVSGLPKGDTLNLREGPGTKYKAKGTLANGLKLAVLETKPGWARVRTPGGYEGWVSSTYLAAQAPQKPQEPPKPVPAPTPPPPPASPAPAPSKPAEMAPGSYRYSDFAHSWAMRFEGLRTSPYWDHNDWAVCWGHNNASNVPPPVKENDPPRTRKECEEILRRDMDLQQSYLNKLAKVPLSQGEIDAWVLHIFQQGPGNFRNSEELKLLNSGDRAGACDYLFNRKHKLAGVTRRFQTLGRICRGEKPTKW